MTEDKTIWWNDENSSVMLIDQTLLPTEYKVIEITEVSRLADAIRRLEVRGAPALGVAGAFGVALSATRCVSDVEFDETIASDAALLKSTRPTAVNLAWGVDKVLRSMENLPPEMARIMALFAAKNIAENDTKACMLLGHNGASLLPQIGTVLTHCNAGALACSSWGTALGVIRSAKKMGKKISVISCETRPLLQGSRLTAWELARDDIPVTTIVDSEAAFLMRQGKIDAVIVGADRITKDAVFNKIGTYMHAVCAKHHGIPFYVAAPVSTFDAEASETDITIEQRDRNEVSGFFGRTTVPENVPVINYAFDATPLALVTAIITEKGVLYPPYDFQDMK
ncbi:MAG: S-methyl-5-thioribose-1-phosphate isomerase [Methanocorpusculum sp.]|uniref:S-methyl-5-thioribose-1-phosphate isomerase n=1 Tax=Methanocorpusculum sp. TaxID=2058474 RepID=UPI002719F0E0|nr:S-methyl-5-thioribose-1-phosphate isomerase [Methanocorpusculum sp.]MDO9523867.1 S-methyl-5-thioribose-1-phosphate isomerase [Methanocorpusculum sp.]